jgi:transmembrane sensor
VTIMKPDDDSAERWAIRIDAGPLKHHEQAELDCWLAEDERRQGALLRAEAALAYLDRARALGYVSPDNEATIAPPLYRRRSVLAIGSLGGLAAAGLGGLLISQPGTERIDTVIGEVRRVPLADGSVASLNTASRIAVQMKPERRLVKLEDGEAWFQVAHDKSRPFVVEAGDVRVQAIGTAFSVRRRGDGADVLVTEGAVETWVVGREQARTRIAAGNKSFVADDAPAIRVVQASDQIDRELAWRSGELALNGETLGYAVAELNRYNERKLVVDDAELSREPLVGYFRTNDPENFGKAVAGMVGARVTNDGQTIRIVRPGT